jgi:hypothetical protein
MIFFLLHPTLDQYVVISCLFHKHFEKCLENQLGTTSREVPVDGLLREIPIPVVTSPVVASPVVTRIGAVLVACSSL